MSTLSILFSGMAEVDFNQPQRVFGGYNNSPRMLPDASSHSLYPVGTGFSRNSAIHRPRGSMPYIQHPSDAGKRPRAWANAYELSTDLREKRLQLLEKKYGGSARARRAAVVIQHAYRHYAMSRNFARMRWEADEKRLSRRFADFSRSRTIWSEMAVTVGRGIAEEGGAENEDEFNLAYDIMTHSFSADNMRRHLVSTTTATAAVCRTRTLNERYVKVTSLVSHRLSKLPDSAESADCLVNSLDKRYESARRMSIDRTIRLREQNEGGLTHTSRDIFTVTENISDSLPVVTQDVVNDKLLKAGGQSGGGSRGHDNKPRAGPSGTILTSSCGSKFPVADAPELNSCANVTMRPKKPDMITVPIVHTNVSDVVDFNPVLQTSPIWKRKSLTPEVDGNVLTARLSTGGGEFATNDLEYDRTLSDSKEVFIGCKDQERRPSSEEGGSSSYQRTESPSKLNQTSTVLQPRTTSDGKRKRMYRVGLNLFNKYDSFNSNPLIIY